MNNNYLRDLTNMDNSIDQTNLDNSTDQTNINTKGDLRLTNKGLKGKQLLDELTEVRESKIGGLGLFAKKDIPKGTCWYDYDPKDVMLISQSQYNALIQSKKSPVSEGLIQAIQTYAYYEENLDSIVFCLDNGRFVNHSYNPNSGEDELRSSLRSVALRDIHKDEEITENYLSYGLCRWAITCADFLKSNPKNIK